MRLTRFLLVQYRKGNKIARAPQDIKNVPYKSILPLRLRERGLSYETFSEKLLFINK